MLESDDGDAPPTTTTVQLWNSTAGGIRMLCARHSPRCSFDLLALVLDGVAEQSNSRRSEGGRSDRMLAHFLACTFS